MSDLAGFEEMLGGPIPVLSNRHVARLLEGGQLTIDPFEAGRLGPTSYRLCPVQTPLPLRGRRGTSDPRTKAISLTLSKVTRYGQVSMR